MFSFSCFLKFRDYQLGAASAQTLSPIKTQATRAARVPPPNNRNTGGAPQAPSPPATLSRNSGFQPDPVTQASSPARGVAEAAPRRVNRDDW